MHGVKDCTFSILFTRMFREDQKYESSKSRLGHNQRVLEFFRQERKVERTIQNKSRKIAMKGTIAGQSGDLEEAEHQFLKALKLDPESIDSYIGLSKTYGRCHRMEDKFKYMKLGIQTCSYLILIANHKEEEQLTTKYTQRKHVASKITKA